MAPIWPTSDGDHRAANHSSGVGARHGRVRWRAPVRGGLVVDEHRIVVASADATRLLDAKGAVVGRLPGLGGSCPVVWLAAGALVSWSGDEESLRWVLDLPGASRSGVPIIGPDGTTLVGTDEGLFAIE
jgi:hypothetical protein